MTHSSAPQNKPGRNQPNLLSTILMAHGAVWVLACILALFLTPLTYFVVEQFRPLMTSVWEAFAPSLLAVAAYLYSPWQTAFLLKISSTPEDVIVIGPARERLNRDRARKDAADKTDNP